MKSRFYTGILLVLLSTDNCFSQESKHPYLDSLLKILPSVKGEKEADVLFYIADAYYDRLEDPEKAAPYAAKALAASEKLSYKKGLAQSYLILARLKDYDEKYDEASQDFFNALMSVNLAKKNSSGKYDQIILPQNDPDIGKLIGDINFHFGNTLSKKLNISKAIERLLDGLRYNELSLEILKTKFRENMEKAGRPVNKEAFTVKLANDYVKDFPNDKESAEILRKSSFVLMGMRMVYRSLGDEFSRIKNYDQSVFYLKKGLRNAEEVGAKLSYLKLLVSISETYLEVKQYDSCIVYSNKLRVNSQKQLKIVWVALADRHLARCYSEKGELMKALDCLKEIDSTLQPLRNGTWKGNKYYDWVSDDGEAKSISLSQSAFNFILIGDVYARTNLHEKEAKENYLLAIENFKKAAENEAIPGVSINNYGPWLNRNMGEIYSKAGMHAKAIPMLELVLPELDRINNKEEELYFYKTLYESYERAGDSKKSYFYFKKHAALKDSLFGQQNSNEITQIQKRFEVEKKDADIELLNKAQEAQEAELEKQKTVRNFFIAGSIVFLLLAFIIFRSLIQNRKAKKEIEHQKELVDDKQKDIMDSINYARRIQRTQLPSEKYIAKNLSKLNDKR
jgi:tetratricopeptide (TPR) repeat protein